MTVAVVVLTYNRPDALLAVLRALAPQCADACEVLIADDGSTQACIDAMREGMPRFTCPVRHVWHPDTGFTAARARNLAAARTDARYLVFLDGDCIPSPDFLAMHRRLAQPGYFVNGSRVLLDRTMTGAVLAGECDPANATATGWIQRRLAGRTNKLWPLFRWPAAPGRVQRRFRWKAIHSCNFAVWASDFAAINGFDESFHGWGHEDADLVLRLHRHGALRTDGYWATEVFHLWHAQNSRDNELVNRNAVLQRMHGVQTRAAIGVAQALDAPDVRVTVLNDRLAQTGQMTG